MIGLALLPKDPGFLSGLDHFGFEVADIEQVTTEMKRCFPDILVTQRLEAAGFAAMRIHDPAGIHIDLAQKGAANLKDGYREDGWDQPRHFHPLAIRAAKPIVVAEFYQQILGLNRILAWPVQDEICLSDGESYLIIRCCENISYEE